jgi:hypothetical protein
VTIKAKPWKPETMRGRYMVNIYIRFDDGTYRERPVIDARSIKDAERWGEARVGEIHAERKAKPVVVAPVAVAAPVAPVGNGETVSAWYERYYREAELGRVGNKNHGKPQVSVTERRGRFRNHIKPLIGDRPIAAVTEDELRAIVEILDDKIRLRVTYYADLDPTEEREGAKPGMSWKNAAHIWSEITSGFREARGSKLADLRIAGMADITKDVFPPMRVEDRVQAALLPIELTTLLACEVVPLERRRCYAMAAYLGARYS